ncbi:sugar phosphate isomerase/epimerase family protein [Agrobacterium tumefaciens]|uniref:sugar phosphate isomerase/epimerase family protein n=1 Tax=Agrobacterium tumefaciens TaxID=358 RepID=UPI002244B5E6|nr:sugar phosphate isomerase/epimerase [Agrobacterium tumefaciens]MCW8061251.1 sugar phosphate isomerase/epimerase [Agrobacterium tumefaciens]MCW8147490.1 sugar phosphate isomerase/epimerase [Agrobacterium tumefaciens]
MKLAICTDVMANLSFTDMLDKCVALGVEGIEMTGGGWSSGPHFRADELLANKGLLKSKLKEIEARGLEIAALNCSANPLDPGDMGKRHLKEMQDTVRLAGEIGVTKIVTMSGLPEAAPGDTVPNWLVYTKSWPNEMPERDRYQWEDRTFPLWHGLVKLAKEAGVEKYALENFSAMLVWNPGTLFRLRNEVGPTVGMNLDPSHLMWMGADPIASARALGGAIHHCHGKDTRIERGLADVNGLLELKEVTDVANRSWNYVAVGAGRDLQWWKEFFSVVRMAGYNSWVSLEMEDFTMSTEAGIQSSIDALQATISR